MKTTLTHLSEDQQEDIQQIVEIIQSVAAPAIIILFGSYGRGDCVDKHYEEDGILHHVQSDIDLLLIVDNAHQATKLERSNALKTQLQQLINAPVNFIVHDIDFINKRLRKAQYFFSDIMIEGVQLFNSGTYELAEPRELSASERKKMAEEDFEGWFKKANTFFKLYRYCVQEKDYSEAAFMLHQTTEFLYNTFLLVFTRYLPNTHDLDKLRKRVHSIDPEFLNIFPLDNETHKHCFELLCEAYVRGRYKPSYSVTEEELSWLADRVQLLRARVEQRCQEKITSF